MNRLERELRTQLLAVDGVADATVQQQDEKLVATVRCSASADAGVERVAKAYSDSVGIWVQTMTIHLSK